MLGSKGLDRQERPCQLNAFSSGPADNPASWEGVIRHVFKNERAILQMVDFKGRVRAEWDEYLADSRGSVGVLDWQPLPFGLPFLP